MPGSSRTKNRGKLDIARFLAAREGHAFDLRQYRNASEIHQTCLLGDYMKILVFAHELHMGGSQRNAIDLSVSLRDTYGHDVVIFATPGPMVKVAEEKGLRVVSAPSRTRIPSLAMMGALREVVRRERPDLVHVWDWWQCVDAYYAIHLVAQIPMIVSDTLSDGITRLLPKTLLTTFGTPEIVGRARAAGRRRVELLVPPVDVDANAPGSVDPRTFRRQYNIEASDVMLVTVSRLAVTLKGESLRRTIDAVRVLGREPCLRLVIVGDGNARNELERLAAETNAGLGRAAVILTGELLDPRPAYAAADIVVGMGGSALRGMAFAKPVVIVGEKGFAATLTPETAEAFYYRGIYGIGDGTPSNASLITDIRELAESPDKRSTLGAFSRQFVLNHFALETVSAELERFCRAIVAERRRPLVAVADGLRTAALLQCGKFVPDSIRRFVKNRELRKSSTSNRQGEPGLLSSNSKG
jgi:L-malate glycosyltransferase